MNSEVKNLIKKIIKKRGGGSQEEKEANQEKLKYRPGALYIYILNY